MNGSDLDPTFGRALQVQSLNQDVMGMGNLTLSIVLVAVSKRNCLETGSSALIPRLARGGKGWQAGK